jgi:thymidylate synthase (FAD)
MRIVPPSYEILTALDNGSMAARIESCGRICYKSEGKITENSAGPFIENILKRGHNSVSEMAVLTLQIDYDSKSVAERFFEGIPKYFAIDHIDKQRLLITGSVRAFRELYKEQATQKMAKAIAAFLGERYPLFFFDLLPKNGWRPQSGISIVKVPLPQVDKMAVDLLIRHRYVAVKIITNRAVTHEIVRHRPVSYLQESQRYCRYDQDQFGSEVTFIKPMFYNEGTPEYDLWCKAMEDTEAIYLKLLESSTAQAARTVLPNSCKTEIIVFANLIEWLHIFKLRTAPGAEPSMREIMIPLLGDFKKLFPKIFEGLEVKQ